MRERWIGGVGSRWKEKLRAAGSFWVVSGFLARPSVVRDNDINSKEKAEEENIYIVSLMDQPSLSSLSSRDYRDCGMVHVNIQIFFVRIMHFFFYFSTSLEWLRRCVKEEEENIYRILNGPTESLLSPLSRLSRLWNGSLFELCVFFYFSTRFDYVKERKIDNSSIDEKWKKRNMCCGIKKIEPWNTHEISPV